MAPRPTPTIRAWFLFGLSALVAVGADSQTQVPSSDPGSSGPWTLPGQDPSLEQTVDEKLGVKRNAVWTIRCSIEEIEELGRLYVEDAANRSRYWIQLPTAVKIRAADRESFDGRKKLKLRDLRVGQRLVVTLRVRDDEILRVQVRPPRPLPETAE